MSATLPDVEKSLLPQLGGLPCTAALPLVLTEELDAHREGVPGPLVLELEGDALPSGQSERGAPRRWFPMRPMIHTHKYF